jgi:hypothetical protein
VGRSAPEISVSGQRIIKPISKTGKNLQRRCNVSSSHLCTADPIARAARNHIICFDNDYTAMSKRPVSTATALLADARKVPRRPVLLFPFLFQLLPSGCFPSIENI